MNSETRVLYALRLGPFTILELARMLSCKRSTIRGIVNALRDDGRIKPCGYPEGRRNGRPAMRWGLA